MSNDATAVVLTPAVLTAVRRSNAKPLPFLFACALIANAASFVLPISNPANLVVFHTGMPPLGRWLLSFLIPSVLSITATFFVLRWYFRRDLCQSIESSEHKARLKPEGKLVLGGLALIVVVLLVGSSLKRDLGLPTCLAALVVTAVVSVRNKTNPLPLAREISWATLGLVASLFVLMDAVESIGALHFVESAVLQTQSLGDMSGSLTLAFVVAIGNNLVNNLPLGLIMGSTVNALRIKGLFATAILIGVDLGPNLSVTGSLATILWLLALRREGLDVSALDFLKAGIITMPLSLAAAMTGSLAIHAIFH
jgi:arsenical pump membrane protein